MNELFALATFAIIASGTPGPNNILLWAAGMQFGFRACVPHILGTALGLGTLTLAAAAGTAALIASVPQVELALKVLGSVYLLYLAYQVAGIGMIRRAQLARPLNLWQGMSFQYVNPKAWFFALAAMGAFRPAGLPPALAGVLVAGITMVIVALTASLWAAGGTVLNRLIAGTRMRRGAGIILALTLAATAVFIWL